MAEVGTRAGGVWTIGLRALAFGCALAATAQAQERLPATLVADQIEIQGGTVLIATGAVEVYYEGNRLTAPKLTYDTAKSRMQFDGPLRLTEPRAQGAVLVADSADLSSDLRDGIALGARMVLARELQLAATKITRSEGRYTVLDTVVASACEICASDPVPLWEIRARRITHDATDQVLRYEGAQLRAFGMPVFYLPYLRTPDPSVERMAGFLSPSVRITSLLGAGVKLPYFLPLGESRDLTLTPYLAANNSRTLGLRLREAYRAGWLTLEGAYTRDQIVDGRRGYLFADGSFRLPRGYDLGVTLRLTSDDAYLTNYGISEADRLWSGLTLSRIKADRMVYGRAGYTHSLRDDESALTEPSLAGDVWGRRIYQRFGGEAELKWSLQGLARSSSQDQLGRDTTRSGVSLGWQRNWLLSGGLLANVAGQVEADLYRVWQDSSYDDPITRVVPSVALTLRYPLVRQEGAASELLEPIAQVIYTRPSGEAVPNDDSLLLEFDEGNLFALSRYPGEDGQEAGLRANLGIGWTRQAASGWSLGVTGGRVIRRTDDSTLPASSGLGGTRSDWLSAAHLRTGSGLLLSNRALIADDLTLSREEMRLGFQRGSLDLAMGYLWMEADASESRDQATSELLVDAGWDVAARWRSTLSTRFDYTADRAAYAGLAMKYTNECLATEVSLSRRFTSSTNVSPETALGLSVELAGLGGARRAQGGQCGR